MQNIIITLCGQCGNAFVKICEKTCACQSFIEQNTTNEFDKTIANTLCQTLLQIALIVALTIIIMAVIKYIANHCKEKREKEYKQEQRDFELKKEYQAKVLDYLKGEMDSFNKVPKLIAEIDKMQKAIDEVKDKEDENSIYKLKDSFEELYETVIGNKDFWDKLHKAYSDGKIKMEASNLNSEYITKLKDYINGLATK